MPNREHGIVEHLTVLDSEVAGTIRTLDAAHKPTEQRVNFYFFDDSFTLEVGSKVSFVLESDGESSWAKSLEPMGLWRNSDDFRRSLRS